MLSDTALGVDQDGLFLSEKITFDVANPAEGDVSGKKEKKNKREEKEGKKKKIF